MCVIDLTVLPFLGDENQNGKVKRSEDRMRKVNGKWKKLMDERNLHGLCLL